MHQNRLLLPFLTDEGLDRVEATAYRLLAEVGIDLQHDRAREMLHGLGCRDSNGRTLISGDVVHWALANVTPGVEFLRPDGRPGFTLGDRQVRFHNGGGQPFVRDLQTGERRLALLQDVADSTRLLDALPNVDHITPLVGPQDVPPALILIEATAAMLLNTHKPVSAAAVDRPEDVPYLVEMAAARCGGPEALRARPTMQISVSPISPLRFTANVAGAILAVAEAGLPFHSLPAPSLGATGPVTLAGCLAQQHAEVLASLVLAAAARPGVPVVYCSRIGPIDPRTALSAWGGPEVGMSGACAAQLAHRLGLPCDSYGLATSSPFLDAQHAYERLANALVPALAGVDLLSGMGMAGNLSGGYDIAVIDDELVSLIKHIVAGVEVDDTTLAYDVMRDVIPAGGAFVGALHTARQMRKGALWIPGISARGAEAPAAVDRARARARDILAGHQLEPLSDDVMRHIGEIVSRARRELGSG